jgi:hypothetical protein
MTEPSQPAPGSVYIGPDPSGQFPEATDFNPDHWVSPEDDQLYPLEREHPELWETVWTALHENSNTLTTPVLDRLAIGVVKALLDEGVVSG